MENVKALIVVHENLYSAKIDSEGILSVYEDDTVVRISLKNNYRYEDSGLPRWDSIQPFDKDEITSMQLELENGEIKDIRVPFHDVSTNGALCMNERSKVYEEEHVITIEWEK